MPKNKKILLVEDDDAIREMYQIKFESSGLEVDVATDGKQALIKAIQIKPDLMLLDLRMPIIDGEIVLRKLQRFKWAERMKVIVITNISFSEAPKALKELRIDKYIVKAHHTPSQIMKEVKSLLSV
ncbi:MAG TPA: response regulator [Candidatus Saccharibacteria bacterium]|nr:response regulator [Candidatus Saccharibacteria bacterium]